MFTDSIDHLQRFPSYSIGGVLLICGDCRDVVPYLRDNKYTAVVTDPPYGLSFMSKDWDSDVVGKEFWELFSEFCYPGASFLVFGGTRKFHRLACAIEDAGLDLRDTLCWLYGSGFPKSYSIGKGIDKAAGAEREVVFVRGTKAAYLTDEGYQKRIPDVITAPATPEATIWEGYGTALKPAFEPITVAMKPNDGSFFSSALEYGVSGLNINACRIKYGKGEVDFDSRQKQHVDLGERGWVGNVAKSGTDIQMFKESGRWPANVVLSHTDDCRVIGCKTVKGRVINRFDDGMKPFGNAEGRSYTSEKLPDDSMPVWECAADCPCRVLDEQSDLNLGSAYGGASRFFYCSKASRREKGYFNRHPTVKPVKLMEWLCKLVQMPERNLILDPFAGSGTTILACMNLGIPAIGIEQDFDSYQIACRRLAGKYYGLDTW